MGSLPAVWVAGVHAFAFFGPGGRFEQESLRLARPTLLWQRGELVLRIEGAPTSERALAIAASVG